jgi:hypothetical protein
MHSSSAPEFSAYDSEFQKFKPYLDIKFLRTCSMPQRMLSGMIFPAKRFSTMVGFVPGNMM